VGLVATLAAALLLPVAGAAPAQSVTLAARPAIAPAFAPITLLGAISSPKDHELVTIEVKDCLQKSFRGVLEVPTEPGGRWTTQFYPGITTTIRASWNGASSAPVAVRQAARVFIRRVPASRDFEISINGKMPFWRKKALLQQRAKGAWKTLKTVVLTEQNAAGSQGMVWTSARFKASVPRGTQLRAVLPADQAKPCYVAGVSATMRA
jgi:hypothetical protein